MPSQQMMVGGGGGQIASGHTFVNNNDVSTGVSATHQSTFSSAGAFSSVSDPDNWFTPNQAGIGSFYWAKFTRTSGNAFTVGSEGTWQALSAGYTVGFSATTLARSWTGTVQFATDAAGANIVSSNNLTMVLGRI